MRWRYLLSGLFLFLALLVPEGRILFLILSAFPLLLRPPACPVKP